MVAGIQWESNRISEKRGCCIFSLLYLKEQLQPDLESQFFFVKKKLRLRIQVSQRWLQVGIPNLDTSRGLDHSTGFFLLGSPFAP